MLVGAVIQEIHTSSTVGVSESKGGSLPRHLGTDKLFFLSSSRVHRTSPVRRVVRNVAATEADLDANERWARSGSETRVLMCSRRSIRDSSRLAWPLVCCPVFESRTFRGRVAPFYLGSGACRGLSPLALQATRSLRPGRKIHQRDAPTIGSVTGSSTRQLECECIAADRKT